MSKQKRILWAAIFGNILLGTNAIALKFGVEEIEPITYAGLRYLGMALVFIVFFGTYKSLKHLKHLPDIALNTILVIAYLLSFSYGVALSTPLKAAVLALTVPIFMHILSIIYLKEPLLKRTVLGTIIGLAGSLFIIGLPEIFEQSIQVGDVLLLIGYFSLACSIVHTKYMYKWIKPLDAVTLRLLTSGVVLTIVAFAIFGTESITMLSVSDILPLVYAIFISGALALGLYYTSLKKIKGEEAAALFYLDPLAGALLSVVILDDRLDNIAIAGVALVVIGVFIAQPHKTKHFNFQRILHH